MKFKAVGLVGSLLLCSAGTAFSATLPAEPTMREQLVSVLDETRVEDEFYPQLLSHAGEEMSAQQIADLFAQATDSFLGKMKSGESAMVRVQLVPYVRPFIRALLTESPDEAKAAIDLFYAMQPDQDNE